MKKKLIIVFAAIAGVLLLIPVKKVYEDVETKTDKQAFPNQFFNMERFNRTVKAKERRRDAERYKPLGKQRAYTKRYDTGENMQRA